MIAERVESVKRTLAWCSQLWKDEICYDCARLQKFSTEAGSMR